MPRQARESLSLPFRSMKLCYRIHGYIQQDNTDDGTALRRSFDCVLRFNHHTEHATLLRHLLRVSWTQSSNGVSEQEQNRICALALIHDHFSSERSLFEPTQVAEAHLEEIPTEPPAHASEKFQLWVKAGGEQRVVTAHSAARLLQARCPITTRDAQVLIQEIGARLECEWPEILAQFIRTGGWQEGDLLTRSKAAG